VSVMVDALPPAPQVTVKLEVRDGNTVVSTGSGRIGDTVTMSVPSPKLWHPDTPFLYNLVITIPSDSVTSYFGMRTITLGRGTSPGRNDTGPQASIDRPGSDLPGYPVELPQADPTLCWNMCKQKAGCNAWAYAVPGCDTFQHPMCWLKSGTPGATNNKCRVSGQLAVPGGVARRPFLNGAFTFLVGWLDQSWWPDGQYTAPTDDALAFDLQAVKMFGMNTVRLHQKVNSERWYYHADRLGVVILQDMPQKYGGASAKTVEPFIQDLKAMIAGRYNHPSIVQWDTFNEGDCVGVFNATQIVELTRTLDQSRLVDTNSGGPANDLHIADVNDIHSYPWPGDPVPSATQYAMLGEYGGVGAFVAGHEWVPNQCQTYLHVDTPENEAATYIQMIDIIKQRENDLSVCIYTQITDVERECDGLLNYDRTNKFNQDQTARITAANQALIHG